MVWSDMQWYSYSLCKDMFCIHILGYECVCSAFIYIAIPADAYFLNGYVVNKYVLNGYVWMDTYWRDTYWNDMYWQDTCWMDMCGMMLIRQQSLEEPCDETSFGKKNIKQHTDLTPNWPKFTCKVPCCTSGHATDGTAQVRPQQVKQSHANKGCQAPMAVFSGFSGFVMPPLGDINLTKNLRYI